MKLATYAICVPLLLFAAFPARSQEAVALDKYTCAEFLKDIAEPTNGERLLRSLMMVAWAGGYAAAHQSQNLRADPKSIQIISAMLGNACRSRTDTLATTAIADTVRKFASNHGNSEGKAALLPPPPPGMSRWSQDGSIVDLSANGATRKFVIEVPDTSHKSTGAVKGAVLFAGTKNADRYEGKAYRYFVNCKALAYDVIGEISADEKRVVLRGKAPELDAKCKVTGYGETSTTFDFVPPEAN
jgi:hypothetical protein